MKCEHCGYENDAAARYCSGCGAALNVSDAREKINKPSKRNRWNTYNKVMNVVMAIVVILALSLIALNFSGSNNNYSSANNTCRKSDVDRAMADLRDIQLRWGDAIDIANSTPRIALSSPVANLQEIRRETQKVEVPHCMEELKTIYIDAMDYYIQGYMEFMQDADSTLAGEYIGMGNVAALKVVEMIKEIEACAPNCDNLIVSTKAIFDNHGSPTPYPTNRIVATKSPFPTKTLSKYVQFPTATR
ncbi:MAG: zinc ribbon domain-containing protein [Anaerolineales bacterium]|nr:zinc ribbon domain-containing protein [Anaerolineales bacterium]